MITSTTIILDVAIIKYKVIMSLIDKIIELESIMITLHTLLDYTLPIPSAVSDKDVMLLVGANNQLIHSIDTTYDTFHSQLILLYSSLDDGAIRENLDCTSDDDSPTTSPNTVDHLIIDEYEAWLYLSGSIQNGTMCAYLMYDHYRHTTRYIIYAVVNSNAHQSQSIYTTEFKDEVRMATPRRYGIPDYVLRTYDSGEYVSGIPL